MELLEEDVRHLFARSNISQNTDTGMKLILRPLNQFQNHQNQQCHHADAFLKFLSFHHIQPSCRYLKASL